MTINDLELIECAIRAKRKLLEAVDSAKAGRLEDVRQAWEDIQTISMKAGYRCNALRFKDAPIPDAYQKPHEDRSTDTPAR